MTIKFKLSITKCIIICILFIIVGLIIANSLKPEQKETPTPPPPPANNKLNEYYGYPYYPHIYQSVPEYIYPNDSNIRLQGSGDLLEWNKNPIMPLLIKCRNNNFQSDICKFIIGKQKVYPHTP